MDGAATSEVKPWLDLSRYGLALRLEQDAAGPRLVASGACEAYAHELTALGFGRQQGRGVWARDARLSFRELAAAVAAQFPDCRVVQMERSRFVGPGGPTDGPVAVGYLKVGEQRGAKRLWLEGKRLAQAGFAPDSTFRIVFDVDQREIRLQLDPQGDRKVSGRRRAGREDTTPIIDVASGDLTTVLGDAARVRAVILRGEIRFRLHPVDEARMEREARTIANVRAGVLEEGTLCAGGGVSTLATVEGVAEAGLKSLVHWVVDRERRYLEVADENNPAVSEQTLLFEAALEELEPVLLRKVDLLGVSLPCTGHSPAGKAKRKLEKAEDHPTDALAVVGLLRILDAVQPSVVVSENVPQAATSATYALVRAYLQQSGYKLFERVLDGPDAGALENRKRWWLVAVSEGLADGFTLDRLPVQPRPYAKLGDAMEDVPADDRRWLRVEYLDRKAARDAAAGKGFARQWVGPESTEIGTIGRGYAKRRSTEGSIRREDGSERLLTPVEHARVKGVPEGLVAGVSDTLAHEVLGQSILAGHARALSSTIATHLRTRAAGRPRMG